MKFYVKLNTRVVEQGGPVEIEAAERKEDLFGGLTELEFQSDGNSCHEVFADINRYMVLDKTDNTLRCEDMMTSNQLAFWAWVSIKQECDRVREEARHIWELNAIKNSMADAADETEKHLTTVEINDIIKTHPSDSARCVSEDAFKLELETVDFSTVCMVYSYVQFIHHGGKMYVVFDPADAICGNNDFKSDEFENIEESFNSINTDFGRLEYITNSYNANTIGPNDWMYIEDITKILDHHLGIRVKKVEL